MRYTYVLAGLVSMVAAAPMKMIEESVYIPPIVKRTSADMEKAGAYNSYIPYAEYGPYGSYPRAAEEAAAKLTMATEHMKRNDVKMAEDTDDTEQASYSPYKSHEKCDAASGEAVETTSHYKKRDPKMMAENLGATMAMASYMQKRAEMMMKDAGKMRRKDMQIADQGPERKHHGLVIAASLMSADDEKLEVDAMPISTESYDPKMAKRSMNHPDPSEMASGSNDLASATLPNNWYGKYDPYSNYGEYDVDEASAE